MYLSEKMASPMDINRINGSPRIAVRVAFVALVLSGTLAVALATEALTFEDVSVIAKKASAYIPQASAFIPRQVTDHIPQPSAAHIPPVPTTYTTATDKAAVSAPLDKEKAKRIIERYFVKRDGMDDPQAGWARAIPRLEQADRESIGLIDLQLLGIRDYFTERRKLSFAFAQAVFSEEGKRNATGRVTNVDPRYLDDALIRSPFLRPRSFTVFAEKRFKEDVVNPLELQRLVTHAISGYDGDVGRVEEKLFAELRVDRHAATAAYMSPGSGIPTSSLGYLVSSQIVDAGSTGYIESIVKDAVAVVVGSGANDTADHGPKHDLTDKVNATLDRMCNALIEGDAQAVEAYLYLRNFLGNPDPEARNACQNAITAIQRSGDLGLRHSLLSFYDHRSLARRAILSRAILGSESWPQANQPISAKAQLLSYAHKCESYWKARGR